MLVMRRMWDGRGRRGLEVDVGRSPGWYGHGRQMNCETPASIL